MIYEFADLSLDTGRRELRRSDQSLKLTGLTYKVLVALVEASPNLVTQDELIEKVWGRGRVVSPENIAQRVTMLRQSLGDDPKNPVYVETVFGQGFRLIPEVTVSTSGPSATSASQAGSHRRRGPWAALAATVLVLAGWAGYQLLSSDTGPTEETPVAIAVLPLTNLGTATDDDYFAVGMHHEILNRLAQIPALRVSSQTSVMRYRESPKTLAEIADELRVSLVLEGAIQRQGKQFRVNVQLVDPYRDETLWAKVVSQDYTAEQLFGMQGEIAAAVAGALHAELSPETMAKLDEVLTDSVEAYELYLRALAERSVWREKEMFSAIIALLERAVLIDPDFLGAQVLLMESTGRMAWIGADPDGEYRTRALELLQDIRRRWPDRIEGHLALGHYYYTVERDYARALIEYEIVAKANPNDLETIRAQVASLKRLDRNEAHLELTRRLVELDPGNSLSNGELVIALSRNQLVEQMLAVLDRGNQLFPDEIGWARDTAIYRLSHLGDVAGYLEYGERLRAQGDWRDPDGHLFWMIYASGDIDKAIEYAAAQAGSDYDIDSATSDADLSLMLRMEGRGEEAQVYADRALRYVLDRAKSGRPWPTSNTRFWNIWVAYIAANAGDQEKVGVFQAKYRDSAVVEPSLERFLVELDAFCDALIGDAITGWEKIEPYTEGINPLHSPNFMAVHPYYGYLFGEVPAFREHIARATVTR